MPPRRRKRIDPALFELPVARIRAGYFSDVHFNRSREALRDFEAVLEVNPKNKEAASEVRLVKMRLGK